MAIFDVIRESCGLIDFMRTSPTRPGPSSPCRILNPNRGSVTGDRVLAAGGSPGSLAAAPAMAKPIAVETYLRNRAITALHETGALRFHPRCYYRADENAPTETWPAMIAAVTDPAGTITGAHRTARSRRLHRGASCRADRDALARDG